MLGIQSLASAPAGRIAANLQFFHPEQGCKEEIPAIVQEFRPLFPNMRVIAEKGCTIAGICLHQLNGELKACTFAGF
jgi:hypothetical protein